MRRNPRSTALRVVLLFLVLATGFSAAAQVSEDAQIPEAEMSNAHSRSAKVAPRGHSNGQAHARYGIPNIDSLVNWNDHYFADGFDSNGNPNRHWYYNMVGNPPEHKGTTVINAPIVPVSLDLLRANGTVRFHMDATAFVQPALNSPVFSNATYSSSDVPTQISDAIQRAEFFDRAKSDWHTVLNPVVKPERVMRVPFGKWALFQTRVSRQIFAVIDIGTFQDLLFPPDGANTSTPIGAAEHAGDITTKDMSTFLFSNTFLTFDITNPLGPGNCCVLGFHSYDFEFGDASNGNTERRYVLNYSSWIGPGIFGGGFGDVTPLSHEISETYNDPFVASDNIHNITPWWLAPNGLCQNNLEVGDVIEGLPNATFPITMADGKTYHPQNEALLQWFEFQSPSTAIGQSYSYPNTTTLTSLSTVQKAGCQ